MNNPQHTLSRNELQNKVFDLKDDLHLFQQNCSKIALDALQSKCINDSAHLVQEELHFFESLIKMEETDFIKKINDLSGYELVLFKNICKKNNHNADGLSILVLIDLFLDIKTVRDNYEFNALENPEIAYHFCDNLIQVFKKHEIKLMEHPGFFNQLLGYINQLINKLTGMQDFFNTHKSIFGSNPAVIDHKNNILQHFAFFKENKNATFIDTKSSNNAQKPEAEFYF